MSGTETAYLYLAEDIIKETAGGIITNYLHGIGIDEPIMMDRAGAKSYYFSAGLGSIREMTDGMGAVQNSYTYGTWGELRTQNVTIPNSYGYTGREFAEDGLYYYRARYMNPELGKFISKDQVGLQAGLQTDINLYNYVRNNPTLYKDSFGLKITLTTCQEELRQCFRKAALEELDCEAKTHKWFILCEMACALACILTAEAWPLCFAECSKDVCLPVKLIGTGACATGSTIDIKNCLNEFSNCVKNQNKKRDACLIKK